MDMLVAYGCDHAQGYFYTRPCHATDFIAWLTDSPYQARTAEDVAEADVLSLPVRASAAPA